MHEANEDFDPDEPLPPGYELIPVDQLTPEHEVVPWEELPGLMKRHNIKPSTLNLALYGYGALAELEAALVKGNEVSKEVLGKVRHVKNTFEVCCVNSDAKDFVSYGWILARDYAWKVENKVE